MAYIGLRKTYIAKLESGSYTGPETVGHAVSTEVTPNFAEGELYGDDMVVESDREFVDADINIGVTTVPKAFNDTMFGNTVGADGVTHNANDEPNFVGYGTIGVEKVDGVKKFVGMFMPKCKFFEPGVSMNTKGNSITYNTPSITGKGYAKDNGDWKYTEVFDTEAGAIAWIETKFGGGLLGEFSEFSTSETYSVGDYVTYGYDLYRCTAAVTEAGAWDGSKWLKVAEGVTG